MKPKFNDFPLEEVVKQADDRVDEIMNGGGHAYTMQKWTCRHCGARQTMEDRNTFYRSGRCEECDKVTPITKCNYTLVIEG
jgi:hypothetical protein